MPIPSYAKTNLTQRQRRFIGLSLVGGGLMLFLIKRRTSTTWPSTAPELPANLAKYQVLFDVSYMAATEYGVPPEWLIATALHESKGSFYARNTKDPGTGAWGAWQFLEPTARGVGWTDSMTSFLADPLGQARIAAKFMLANAKRCGWSYEQVAAAHNSGRCLSQAPASTRNHYIPNAITAMQKTEQLISAAVA